MGLKEQFKQSEGCEHEDIRVVIRATDAKEQWGDAQVVECRDCGERWSK